ncbi:MAG: zinc-binding dehydrogenase [Myxococcales bacterium]|nr:zinc-binding dehydrogenase [Myxococcales bacterium]
MNATRIVIHRAGSYEQLRVESHPAPRPKAGEVAIDVKATGVNYADVIVRMGLYASAKELVGWPITPGFEVAGVVRELGEGVTDLEVGDRVVAGLLFGGYASAVVAPRRQVWRLPDALSFEEGAGIPAVYLTGWFALHFLAHPRRGDRVLVHSAAGGVGSVLVQMAKRLGCEVTGVVGRAEKVDVARELGCDHVIDKSSEDLWARAKAISARGFDVVLDANGVETLAKSYAHLRPAGKLVVYGFATMMPKTGGKPSYPKLALDWLRTPRFNPLDLTNQSKSVLAFNLSYLFDRMDLLGEAMEDVLAWIARGELKPPATTTYPLDQVAEAHRHIESGKSTGKLILIP